jgi:hypothetical protein
LSAEGTSGAQSAELERLGFVGVERRTNAAIALVWIALWLVAAVTTRALTGEWHGLSWGFVVGGALSLIGTWFLYVRPARRRRIAARLTWHGDTLDVIGSAGEAIACIGLARPHRALLVVAKGEGRALLRVEQVQDAKATCDAAASSTRVEVFAPLPAVLPMKIVGEARSLQPLMTKSRGRRRQTSFAYRMGAPEATASEQMTALMAFIESRREHRVDRVVVPLHEGVLSVRAERLSIEIHGETASFDSADAPSLRVAVETAARAVPPSDESVESLVINHVVRRILLRRFPEHPLLETLRR